MIVIINEDYQVKVDNYANYTLLKAVRDESGAIKTGKDKIYLCSLQKATIPT